MIRGAALLALAACILAGAKPKPGALRSEVEVLVVPPMSVARPLPAMHRNQFRAFLDGQELEVVSVEGKERASRTPVVLVLDFGSTQFRNHHCLMAELMPLMEELGKRRMVEIWTTGTTYRGLVYPSFEVTNRGRRLNTGDRLFLTFRTPPHRVWRPCGPPRYR